MARAQAQNIESFETPRDRERRAEQRHVPLSGPERQRRMSEIIDRIATEDRELLADLAR
jgi:hypothetical protein